MRFHGHGLLLHPFAGSGGFVGCHQQFVFALWCAGTNGIVHILEPVRVFQHLAKDQAQTGIGGKLVPDRNDSARRNFRIEDSRGFPTACRAAFRAGCGCADTPASIAETPSTRTASRYSNRRFTVVCRLLDSQSHHAADDPFHMVPGIERAVRAAIGIFPFRITHHRMMRDAMREIILAHVGIPSTRPLHTGVCDLPIRGAASGN